MLYLGWYESQQKLKESKIDPSNLELIQKELDIKRKLVNAEMFKDQLESAKKQLNISDESLDEAYKKIEEQKNSKENITNMLSCSKPDLNEMISTLKKCIR